MQSNINTTTASFVFPYTDNKFRYGSPSAFWAVPMAHISQEVCPWLDWKFPFGHKIQVCCPVLSWYDPGLHGGQVAPPKYQKQINEENIVILLFETIIFLNKKSDEKNLLHGYWRDVSYFSSISKT